MKSELASIVFLLLLATFIVGIGLSLYSAMTPLRFTVRNSLLATFWICLWCVAILNSSEHNPVILMVILSIFIVLGPFIAVGALFGNTLKGLRIGTSTVGVLTLLVLFLQVLAMFHVSL